MRRATGSRPWQVHLFALIMIGVGLWAYVDQMWTVAQDSNWFRTDLADDLSLGAMIFVLSFQFSIFAIPALIVWVFASRIAKWVVTGTSIWGTFWLVYDLNQYGHPLDTAALTVLSALPTGLAWLLLFTPAANRWFADHRKPHVTAFK
ncbi:hypothetical protein OZN62_09290 [Aurantiacibacter sp. MUD11]|uniref:hypothetical protein n=1 Tax=Aurantiacibacter sp. MUD11 TaxID=3003265 RepID=UPI0022AA5B3C|nr:hypothetical protein [Aurantiacibacter sp. MUD11]WAT17128.1 hypothetical protein OZN62_09290 [Aurantiacibacter sp. MUD11]